MTDSWTRALKEYAYPVDLAKYELAGDFPLGWFEQELSKGDRTETIAFENRFRGKARNHIEAWYEVIFWKYYSFDAFRDEQTSERVGRVADSKAPEIIKLIEDAGASEELVNQTAQFFGYNRQGTEEVIEITPARLLDNCWGFIENPSLQSFQAFRDILFKTDVIATAATFPAFLKPDDFPMVDRQVARWARENGAVHDYAGCGGPTLVTRPDLGERVLTDRDWDFVQSWIEWCRFTAQRLTDLTGCHWRARDAEMAVYTAQTKRRTLEPLCGQ